MEVKVCKHHQRGYCKFQEECHHHHENELCKFKSCAYKDCSKRHPKLCKYFRENDFCKYGKGCAYAHVEKVNKSEMFRMTEDFKI